MSKKIIKHIQFKDGSYEIEEVEETNFKRLEEIKLHNKEVRKYVYETKKITSKFTVEQVQQMTGHEFEDDSLDPLEKLLEAYEGNFIQLKEEKFEIALKLLGQAMATLTIKQKEIFELVNIDSKSRREIAQEMNVSHAAVNKTYNLALKKLRKFFLAQNDFETYFPKLRNI